MLRAELASRRPPRTWTRASDSAARSNTHSLRGASVVAAYSPTESGDELYLSESAGVPRTLYGLRDSYVLTGGSPRWTRTARADRCGSARRRSPAAPMPAGCRPRTSGWPSCPCRTAGAAVAAGERPGGFDEEDRECLGLIAEAAPPAPDSPRATAARPTSSFDLAMDTGHLEVDREMLELFGLDPAEFDGKVESLLSMTVPEDLPTLMSVVEADHMSIGDRELEFRILQPSGEPEAATAARPSRARRRGAPGAPRWAPSPTPPSCAPASATWPASSDSPRPSPPRAPSATSAGPWWPRCGAPCGPTGSPSPSWRATGSSSPSSTLPNPKPGPRCGAPSGEARRPDAPVRAMPTLEAALIEATRPWPAAAALEPALADVGPGGLAILPLPAGGRMAGACLIGWDDPHEFGSDERALLTASAGLAGQALTRARAFDAEHELVGMLQRSLLPRRLPRIPGAVAVARDLPTTAGLEVGGDWYDVIPLPDNHVALVIGDVQGHNAQAATLMGQMRTALRAYAVEGHPPDVVVQHANRLLMDLETDLFVTCCYVDVDLEEGTAWCVRAGHTIRPCCATRTAQRRSPCRRVDHHWASSPRRTSR